MKKLLVSVLAIAGLVACNNEQTLVQKGNAPMEFGASFVENATRATDPSTTTNSLAGFDVWAFMDSANGVVFNGEDVTKSDNGFGYTNTQYWTPGHVYYFAALAPMNSANANVLIASGDAAKHGLGTVEFTNVNGTEDLLYAATIVSTEDKEVGEEVAPVKFQLNHLLSKVVFSFTNDFMNDNASIEVTNIRMEVPAQGSINLAQADWWSTNQWVLGEGTTVLEFGDMDVEKAGYNTRATSQFERLTIPTDAAQSYNVTFDVKLFMGDVEAYAATLTTVIEGAELKIGKAYNFHAKINSSNIVPGEDAALQEIKFDIAEVKEWENGNGYDGGVIEVNTVEAALLEAGLNGGTFALTENVALTQSLVVKKDLVLNLNGHNLVAESTDAIVVEGANLTINGEGDVKAATDDKSSANALWVKHGNVVINGGNYYVGADNGLRNDCIYLGAASLKAEAANYKSTITINGGTFEAKAMEYDQYWVLNVQDDFYRAGSDIVVKGGSYKNFNPANNKSEGANTNFVAEYYESVETAGVFEVRPAYVASKAAIQSLLADGVTEFNANGAEIGDLNAAFTKANVPAGVTVTVKNAKVAGRSYGNKLDGNVVFEDCEFNNASGAYSIHFDGGNGNVTFKNCTLYGWNSFGDIGSVTMEGCKLFGNGLYSMIRSYTLLTVTNCEFDFTNANHTDEWPETVEAIEGGVLVEENCKYIR